MPPINRLMLSHNVSNSVQHYKILPSLIQFRFEIVLSLCAIVLILFSQIEYLIKVGLIVVLVFNYFFFKFNSKPLVNKIEIRNDKLFIAQTNSLEWMEVDHFEVNQNRFFVVVKLVFNSCNQNLILSHDNFEQPYFFNQLMQYLIQKKLTNG